MKKKVMLCFAFYPEIAFIVIYIQKGFLSKNADNFLISLIVLKHVFEYIVNNNDVIIILFTIKYICDMSV